MVLKNMADRGIEMEREVVLSTQQFHQVDFKKFPKYKDAQTGELNFKLLDGMMCEDIALQIPPAIRKSVSVDFSTLDYERLVAETKAKHALERTMTDEEMRSVQDHLLQTIFGETQNETR